MCMYNTVTTAVADLRGAMQRFQELCSEAAALMPTHSMSSQRALMLQIVIQKKEKEDKPGTCHRRFQHAQAISSVKDGHDMLYT